MSARSRTIRERVGLFGGTFDPPHIGHLALAEWARVELALDRVVFIPAGRPPHKRAERSSSARLRWTLTRLATRGHAAFEVSDVELRRRGPSYTADTVRVLAERWPGAALFLLMGADMFETFGDWVRPRDILAHARLAVALRPGVARPRASRWSSVGHGVVWLRNPGLEVSSSSLRRRARAGQSVRYLVPEAVARAIESGDLYRGRPARRRRAPARRSA